VHSFAARALPWKSPLGAARKSDSLATAEVISNVERKSLSIFRQSSTVFAAQVLMLVAGVLSNFIVARLGGPDGKGYIYSLQLFSSSALIFVNFGIGPAAVYHFRRADGLTLREITASLLWPSLLLGWVPLATLAVLRRAPLACFHSSLWDGALIAFAAVPALTLVWNLSYLYLAKNEIGGYNLLRAAQTFLFAPLLLGLLVAHVTQLRLLVTAWIVSAWAPALLAMLPLARAGGVWSLPSRESIRHAFAFAWRSHLGAVVQYLQYRIDVVLILCFLPLRDLGIYSLAIGLTGLLWYVPLSVSQVLLPHVAGSDEADADRITSAFCRASVTSTAVLSLLLAVMSTLVIPWLLPAFRPAVLLIWILLPGTVVASIFQVLASDLNGRGRPLKTLFPGCAALMLSVAGCSFAIPRFGMIGAAAVTSLAYLLNASLYVHRFCRSRSVSVRCLLLLQTHDLLWYRKLLLAWGRG
jgi:O-antigen/teichoic acid export membrane protein